MDDPPFLPDFEIWPTKTITYHQTDPVPTNATTTDLEPHTTTILEGGQATKTVGDRGGPLWAVKNASVNAATAVTLGGTAGAGHMGSLGMLTVSQVDTRG